MSTATATFPTTEYISSESRTRSVWRVGIVATLVGAAVTELFALAARAIDVPMAAADPGVDRAKDIPVGGFFMAVVIWGLVGVVLAAALRRWTRNPARVFVITTVTLTVLSLLGPAFAGATETSTKIVLAVAHLIAAAVIIPPIARQLETH
jgi:hypothetical protein